MTAKRHAGEPQGKTEAAGHRKATSLVLKAKELRRA